jgi:hypothetical protein
MDELMGKKPPARTILDIQDMGSCFESQSSLRDSQILSHTVSYQRYRLSRVNELLSC